VKKSYQGFTLIEVLISVLIMSVGILGAAGLQLRGLDANRDAFYRTTATLVASDIMNRIEVNPTITYAVDDTKTPADFSSVSSCSTADCNPAAMAQHDIAHWLCSINSSNAGTEYAICGDLSAQGSLPNGKGSIAKTGDEYAIRVEWSDIKSNPAQPSSVVMYMVVP
jgi:type IV pilus assembly protein PilV